MAIDEDADCGSVGRPFQLRFLRALRRLRITPIFTPTDASWLNLIEAQFGVPERFTLTDTDDVTHAERHRQIYRFLRYRHRARMVSPQRRAE